MTSTDESLTVRRRNRLRHHYTLTPNVLLFGYRMLTDAEKLTYQVIDSFDWSDGAGLRKGFVYPSLGTLSSLRGTKERTIRRHLAALERAGLVTRELRPSRTSILWIEEPSDEETKAYLSLVGLDPDTNDRVNPDTDVRPLKKDEEEERQNHVNAAKPKMDADARARRDWLAQEMLEVLHDEHSLGFYRKVAQTVPEQRVFEALSEVRLADREGRVRTSKGALFVALIRKYVEATRKETVTTE
jgi:DNA-binding transcriptional ArsR family regulator